MLKLLQASLLTLALTASIYAGDIGQPVASGDMGQPVAAPASSDAVAAQGDMPNGIIEMGAAILETVLSLF